MNYCKKCESNFEGSGEFCSGCVDAIKRGEKQTKDIESGKIKIPENPNKSASKKKKGKK